MYTASRDGGIKKWDLAAARAGKPAYLASLDGHADWVNDVKLCSELGLLASVSIAAVAAAHQIRAGGVPVPVAHAPEIVRGGDGEGVVGLPRRLGV